MKKLLLISLLYCQITLAFITVGTDADCDINSHIISSAMLSNDEIRITNQQIYDPIRVINRNANISGGFNNCSDAQNNISSQVPSVISGNNEKTPLVIITTAAGGHLLRTIEIKNVSIIEGKNVTSPPDFTIGGGAHIVGNVQVILNDVEVRNNLSTMGGAGMYINGLNGAIVNMNRVNIHDNNTNSNVNGGGIWIDDGAQVNILDSLIESNTARLGGGIIIETGNSNLKISNTKISNNSANQNGGGIYCIGLNTVKIEGASSINNNSANFGGGLYLTSNCNITSVSGDNQNLNTIEYGINNNTASIFGGGAYINSGARFNAIGNNFHYANITNNTVTSANSRGGGIYVAGEGSFFRSINARINGNSADTGSAIFTREKAVAHIRRSSSECFGNQICSEIGENSANFFATILTESCGIVDINQTAIHSNIAAANAVALLQGNLNDSCRSVFEGNVIYNNSKTNNTAVSMIGLDRKYELEFAFNTVVDNNASSIFQMNNTSDSRQILRLNASIIWNAPATIISGSLDMHSFSGNCLGVPDVSKLPDGFGNYLQQLEPLFTNSAIRDYSRTINSPYSDDCNTEEYAPRYHDIIGTVRGHAWISPVLGHYDIGAYEYDDVNFNNVIFRDGFY